MLRSDQLDIIDKYVSEKYFDRVRLINYLNLHEVVGPEIFTYVAEEYDDAYLGKKTVLSPWLYLSDKVNRKIKYEERDCYREVFLFKPEDVETFVRRIPFTFYVKENTYIDENGEEVVYSANLAIDNVFDELGNDPFSVLNYHRNTPLELEEAYQILEFLFYEKGFSLKAIFEYSDIIAENDFDDIYGDWFDYIAKCRTLGWDDVMPKEFYYKYNLAREAMGEPPILFYIWEYNPEAWKENRDDIVFFKRYGNELEFYGKFPCDESGKPVLRWIGVDITNSESVRLIERNGLECKMVVTLNPKTVILALVQERDEVGNPLPKIAPKWIQIYAGPQTMAFNYLMLRKKRKELGYTQQEVADAVEANLRTYQKWESGKTKPDGYYLLRLLNWLDIRDVSEVIIYKSNEEVQ